MHPGRERDTTALRTHAEILPALAAWARDDHPVLGNLGYAEERDTITVAVKTPAGGELTDEQKTSNKAHNGRRAVGERGNSLLKVTFKALRNVSLCPGGAAVSLRPHSSCSTPNTTAQPDYPLSPAITRKGSVTSERPASISLHHQR